MIIYTYFSIKFDFISKFKPLSMPSNQVNFTHCKSIQLSPCRAKLT